MDITKQVKKMIAFMEKEGDERAQEIDAKTDEEFNIFVGQMVQTERRDINAYYKKEEDRVLRQIILSQASAFNASRLRMMLFKQEALETIFDEVVDRVRRDICQKNFYRDIMKCLILQGAVKILAPKLIVRTRKSDVPLAHEVVDDVQSHYHAITGSTVCLVIDETHFLPESVVGGVEMYSSKGNVKIVNTLRYRVNLIRESMMPVVRFHLFGANPRRVWYT